MDSTIGDRHKPCQVRSDPPRFLHDFQNEVLSVPIHDQGTPTRAHAEQACSGLIRCGMILAKLDCSLW